MARTDAESLKRFLQTLPQSDRYILLLSLADGLTPTEVGLVLDLPEATVANRLEVLRREAASSINPAVDSWTPSLPAEAAEAVAVAV